MIPVVHLLLPVVIQIKSNESVGGIRTFSLPVSDPTLHLIDLNDSVFFYNLVF